MFWKGLSESARKRVELGVAVAQEKLLSTHVDHALDLIALVRGELGFTDALEIYTRLLRLDEDAAHNVSTRALAVLGQRGGLDAAWPQRPGDSRELRAEPREAPVEEEGGRWYLFGQLKQRLRGRVNEDLRRRIELIAARSEVAIMNTHVSNAAHFVEFLDTEFDERQAVELYLDALDVRESVAEVIYYLALARVADDVLPPEGSGLQTLQGERDPRQPESAGRLRTVD